jgi:chromosome segregation ATPase
MAGTLFIGCDTDKQKADSAEENVEDARQDLKNAQQDAYTAAQKVATAEEWNAFKADTEVKITRHEKRIAELRVKLNKPGTNMDKSLANRIDALEQKNKDLRIRITTHDSTQSDWDSFKREFNHDMDELGKALSDFAENNKN